MNGPKPFRYRILGSIGSGGMGVVYRAEDTTLKRNVALKFLPRELSGRHDLRLRFLREARTAAALNHSNICTIHDVGEVEQGAEVGLASGDQPIPGGTPYIAMELIEGWTLQALLNRTSSLPLSELLDIAVQVAEGLAEAHARGIVHRDLKPQNVMVTPGGRAKILDFGLAKFFESPKLGEEAMSLAETISHELTREGKVVGTTAYMSPEQVLGKAVDPRSDIFAFGTMIYEMVAGRNPFRGETATVTMAKILESEPESLSKLKSGVPAPLELILRRCLEKRPEARYNDTRDLLADLKELSQKTFTGALRDSKGLFSTEGKEGLLAVGPAPPRSSRWRYPLAGMGFGAATLVISLAVLNWLGIREWLFGGGTPSRIHSLAVLPLENLSEDPQQEYFAEGMTEVLISNLAKIGALRVISRTSVAQFKGVHRSLPDIARQLNVEGVIEGSVQRSGERVRITVQLIDAATDRHLWAENYDRDMRDVLVLQSDVARAIVREIKVRLSPQAAAGLETNQHVDASAYEAYLRGRFFLNTKTEQGLKMALEYFKQAIEKDPSYAPAYAGAADSYSTLVDYGYLSPQDLMAKAKAAALRALQLDDALADAHNSLGFTLMDYEWDWSAAEREFRRAIDLSPNLAAAHQLYAVLLHDLGRENEALKQASLAQGLDPRSPSIHVTLGYYYYAAGQYDQAITEAHKALEVDPNFFHAHWLLGWVYFHNNRLETGLSELQRAADLSGRGPYYLAWLGYAYAKHGNRSAAKKVLEELNAASFERYVPFYALALVHAGLGNRATATDLLERAYESHESALRELKVAEEFSSLRAEPRFLRLVHLVGLSR